MKWAAQNRLLNKAERKRFGLQHFDITALNAFRSSMADTV
jgi:hypothetical protein